MRERGSEELVDGDLYDEGSPEMECVEVDAAADSAADGEIATMVDNAEIKEVAAAVATGVVIEEEPIKDALGGATGEVSSEGAQQPRTRHQLHARSPPINQSINQSINQLVSPFV